MTTEDEERKRKILELIGKQGEIEAQDLHSALWWINRYTLHDDLEKLETEGKICKSGSTKGMIYKLAAVAPKWSEKIKLGTVGGLISTDIDNKNVLDNEPLVRVEVNNPLVWLKKWWQKVISNEGMEISLKLKIKPLTAIMLVVSISALLSGVKIGYEWAKNVLGIVNMTTQGTINLIKPVATPTVVVPVKDSLVGLLMEDEMGKNYYLISENEAITLTGFGLETYVGKRVLITGERVSKQMAVQTVSEVITP